MAYFNKVLNTKYYSVSELADLLDKIQSANITGVSKKYIDAPAAFDTETSSFVDGGNKVGLLYHWQFAIYNEDTDEIYHVVGRTNEEIVELFDILSDWVKKRASHRVYTIDENGKQHYRTRTRRANLIVFVHNLGFEYTFLQGILEFDKVFMTKSNIALYAQYKNIEFRCSYLLSGCKLEELSKYIDDDTTYKLHTLDYSKIRTPKTEITDEETAYMLMDNTVIIKYINTLRRQFGDISRIKRTKNGIVQRRLSEYCMPKGKDSQSIAQKRNYINRILPLQFNNWVEFKLANQAFIGGHCGCDLFYSVTTCENIREADISSSFPAVMCYSRRFPFELYDIYETMDKEVYEKAIEKYAILAQVTFYNVKRKYGPGFIPSKKIYNYNRKTTKAIGNFIDSSDQFTICITEQDYEIYKMFYTWDDVKIEAAHVYTTYYLPRKVIEFLLELYAKKTVLKGNKSEIVQYNLDKQDLDGVYGYSAKSPMQETIEFDEETEKFREVMKRGDTKGYKDELYNFDDINDEVAYYLKKMKEYNGRFYSGQIVIPYLDAIYIQALSKRNLAHAIQCACMWGVYNYDDTDSLLYGECPAVDDYLYNIFNPWVEKQFELMCEEYKFDKDCWKAKTKDGVLKPMGFWEDKGTNKYFKAINPKKYIRVKENGHFEITVAGLPKWEGAKWMAQEFDNNATIYEDETNKENNYIILDDYKAVFDNFQIGLVVPAEHSGKLDREIFRNTMSGTIVDYTGKKYNYVCKSGSYLEKSDYTIKDSSNFSKLLDRAKGETQIER